MGKRPHISLVIIWVIFINFTSSGFSTPRNYPVVDPVPLLVPYQEVDGCDPLIQKLKQDPDWLNKLYDPVLSTSQQIQGRISTLEPIYQCLVQLPSPLSAEKETILRLSYYFLVFVAGMDSAPGGSSLQLVDLVNMDDPALNRLRAETDISVPPGYAFLRIYNDTAAMPPPLRYLFEEEGVAGVTFLTRYIAVLEQTGLPWAEQALQSRSLPRTISHELVHAYVNSNLGAENAARMPAWFHEGVAIHFSNSGENQAIVTPNFTLYTTPPLEYRQYNLNFQYLEARLGDQELHKLIQQSIELGDVDVLLASLNLGSISELSQQALNWEAENQRHRLLIGVVVLGGFAWLLFSGQLRYIGLARPYKNCEICERMFWIWNREQPERFSPAMRIWLNDSTKRNQVYSVYAHLVCQNCQVESQNVWQAYRAEKIEQVETARQVARDTYQQWLLRAPSMASDNNEEMQIISQNEMLEILVNAALSRVFSPPWYNSGDIFVINESLIAMDQDLISNPPHTYDRILTKSDPNQDVPVQFGSVRQKSIDQFVIIWHEKPRIPISLSRVL